MTGLRDRSYLSTNCTEKRQDMVFADYGTYSLIVPIPSKISAILLTATGKVKRMNRNHKHPCRNAFVQPGSSCVRHGCQFLFQLHVIKPARGSSSWWHNA